MTPIIPQISAASALVQLLTEHPDLAERTSWRIDAVIPALHGHVHGAGLDDLTRLAQIMGGTITDRPPYPLRGAMHRPYYLTTVWRDVPVEMVVTVPVPVLDTVPALAAEAVAA